MNDWERLLAADRLVDLVATAIRLRHPKAGAIAAITVSYALGKPDAWIVEATRRLQAWVDAWADGDLAARRPIAERVQAAVMLTGGPSGAAGPAASESG